MKTPLVIFIYKRPENTRKVILSIRNARPKRIYLIADGPKNEAERKSCFETRKAAEDCIDWSCDVIKRYSFKNNGLRNSIEFGLDEVFSKEKMAVLLEDDCLPTKEFFPFCEELLGRYERCIQIAGISGNCFLPISLKIDTDFYFSKYLHIWGWATWSRVWNGYRQDPRPWPRGGFKTFFPNSKKEEQKYWNLIYKRLSTGRVHSWAYPFLADIWSRNMMACAPASNLVWNIGFGPGATNTMDEAICTGAERRQKIYLPLRVPSKCQINDELDLIEFRCHFKKMEGKLPFIQRLIRSLKKRIYKKA